MTKTLSLTMRAALVAGVVGLMAGCSNVTPEQLSAVEAQARAAMSKMASTGDRDRGARAEDSIFSSLNCGGNQRNCGSRLRSRCLITSERWP